MRNILILANLRSINSLSLSPRNDATTIMVSCLNKMRKNKNPKKIVIHSACYAAVGPEELPIIHKKPETTHSTINNTTK